MSFLSPFFLWGLAAAAIPVIIHLINIRKPKKVAFSTLAFFKRLQKSTIKRIKIKQLILLALRFAAVICLALALARPFLPPVFSFTFDANEPKKVGLLIDNSPSMTVVDQSGPFIDQAKEAARQIINLAGEEDQFYIQTTNGEARTAAPVSPGRALDLLETITASNKGNYIAARLSDLKEKLQASGPKRGSIQIISDAQATQLQALDNEEIAHSDSPGRSLLPVQLIKVGEADQRNVAVSNLRQKSQLLSKNNPLLLEVEVTNYSSTPVTNQFVSMEIEGRMVGQYQTELGPGSSGNFTFEITPGKTGYLKGKVIIEGDDVTFDNEYFFSVEIPEKRSLLLVKETSSNSNHTYSSFLEPALAAAGETNAQLFFKTITVDELDKTDWQEHNAIVFEGVTTLPEYLFQDLQTYVQSGNGLLFLPSEKGNISNYNAFLELFNAGTIDGVKGTYASFDPVSKIAQLTQGHPILEDMFEKQQGEEIKLQLPEIYYYYGYKPGINSGGITILKTTTGDELLIERNFGSGTVLISLIGTDPGWSNFPVNPLFAPLYFRSSLYISASDLGGFRNYVLGQPLEIITPPLGKDVEIVKDSSSIKPEVEAVSRVRSGQLITYDAREWEPGWATIQGSDKKISIAVNQHIMESDLTTLSNSRMEEWVGSTESVHSVVDITELDDEQRQQKLNEAGFGKEIWYWFILAALLLLISETVIDKLYRTTNR